MNNAEQKTDTPQGTDVSKGLLRLMGIVVTLDVLAFIAGISFFMIVHGTILGIRWSAPYWKFTRLILVRVTGFPEENVQLSGTQVNWWRGINLFLKAATVIAFLGLGVWFLVRNGFCRQNLICLMNR